MQTIYLSPESSVKKIHPHHPERQSCFNRIGNERVAQIGKSWVMYYPLESDHFQTASCSTSVCSLCPSALCLLSSRARPAWYWDGRKLKLTA